MTYTFIKRMTGLSIVLSFFFSVSFAQLGITDTTPLSCNSHVLHGTISGTVPTGAGISSDDGYSGVIPIGFTFNFYGTNYTQLVIGSNGVLNFDLTLAGAYCPWPISAALLGNPSMRNAICGPWCDIYIPAGGTITRSTTGVAPNRKFAVTWCATAMYSCTTQWTTTQIILYETSNLVEVHLAHKTICAWNSGAAIIGVQNTAGTLATVAPGRDWSPSWSVVTPPEAWRFTPSAGTYTVASIPYAPLPYATSTLYWYSMATVPPTYLGSGPYVTVTPTVVTTYMLGALGCNDTTKAFITINPFVCLHLTANSPCEGDTLWLNAVGDSTGATYKWYGPAPSTSVFATTQKTFIFPATAANNGIYTAIKTTASGSDTATITVNIRHKPVLSASSNAPLCVGAASTLSLTATCDSLSGVTFSWTASPPPFTSNLQNPTKPGFSTSDTGTYRVIATSWFGCKDTATTYVTIVPQPAPPIVSAHTPYCQNETFIPFVVTGGVVSGATVYWYTSATGGTGSVTPPAINTALPGTYKVYFGQTIGSCESNRDSVTVVVNPEPLAITGVMGVCQFLSTTLADATSSGTWSSGSPAIASIGSSTGTVTGHAAGTARITYMLGTGCKATAVVTVYPKPAPPIVPEVRPCQYKSVAALSVTVTPGHSTIWYGLGVTPPMPFAGNTSSIVPNTDTTPGVYYYYVVQKSPFGCISDSAVFPVRIVPEPHAPIPHDTSYCQHDPLVAPLTAIGDSLRWYNTGSAPAGSGSFTAPIPSVENPGVTTYYVTQEQIGCESPKAPLNVTVLYKPEFDITATKDWVCQFDSLILGNTAPPGIVDPGFVWQLPVGAAFVHGTHFNDPNVEIRFDTVWGRHDVYLTISSYGGRCATTESIPIRVVPAPDAHLYVKPDVCLGDTITLALNSHSDNSHTYNWTLDGAPFITSPKVNIISANVNTGGPYVMSFKDLGIHVFSIVGATKEGCASMPTADTVKVHDLPDPRFSVSQIPKKFCVEDSVLFTAVVRDYGYNYKWEPEHSFSNQNKSETWGKVEQVRGNISLTVTDMFGCDATYTKQMNPDECCSVNLPNAFTPNGDGKNDRFHPLFDGYRRFHIFRVTNRWGQTVFETTNSEPSWDGSYNTVPQDMGTYYYYLKYDCGGKALEMKGDVTLIR